MRPKSASRMHPKLTLTCVALAASLALGATAAIAGDGPRRATRGDVDLDPARRHGPAHRACVGVRSGRAGRRRLLQVRQRAGRRQRPQDRLQGRRRRVQRRRRRCRSRAQLVEQDKVFAMFNSLGTAGNLAVRPYLNAMKVPQLFVASGATTWGRDYAQLPVHDRLPAELPGRGMGLRQVPRAHGAGRDDRRPVPERRLRQGSARRAQARPPAVEGEGDRGAAVRRRPRPTSRRRSRS